MTRFAANLTMMFGEWSFLDRFAAAADAGFGAVEFLFPYEHSAADIRSAAERAGVQIVLFNLPPGDWAAGERGIAAFPERAAEFSDALAQGLDYAQELSVPRLHVMAGLAPASDPLHYRRYLDAIREAAVAASGLGIDILLEPLNGRDMPGYLLSDFALAEAVIAEIALPNVKLQFDIYHRQIMHGDVTEALARLMPLIGHVQTASVPARNEPGTGELDDNRIFRLLDGLGYGGHVGCEYRPQAGTLAGLDWFAPWRDRTA